MINNKNVLAVIPARAGSKRLPGKNSKLLHGKPLTQWTLEAALQCPAIDNVLLSTDDTELRELAMKVGCEAPFLRPPELSQDNSTSVDVLNHAIEFYAQQGIHYDVIVLLQPTSPLRNAKHLNSAITQFMEMDADAVISVCKTEHSPLWSNTLPASLSLDSFLNEEIKNKRSQELGDYYRLNGAIYIVSKDRLLEEGTLMLSSNIYAHVMDRYSSVDIDEELDFIFAESLMKHFAGN